MKTCRNCKTLYEENMNFCPNCGSPKIITEAEIEENKLRDEEQKQKELEIAKRHKRRILILSIAALAIVLVVIISVVVIRNVDQNRIIYVDGVAQPSKSEMDNAYEMGMTYYNSGDMQKAINQFILIDQRSSHYIDAQVNMIQASIALRDAQITIADAYISNGNYEEAQAIVDELLEESPTDTITLAKKSEITNAINERNLEIKENAIAQSRTYVSEGYYQKAIDTLNETLVLMPNDQDIQSSIAFASTAYLNDFITRINAYIDEEKYTEASALLQTALQVFPDDIDFLNQVAELQVTRVLADASAKEAQGDLAGAITLLSNVKYEIAQDASVLEMLNRLKATYKQQIIANAEQTYEAEGYLEAYRIIQGGLMVLPSDTELEALKLEYLVKAPINLLDIDYLNNDDLYIRTSSIKDNLGNVHDGAITTGWSGVSYIVFKIDRKYSTLQGLAYLTYGSRSTTRESDIKIYGDDVLLYTSPRFTGGVEPEAFSINIMGVDKLRIETSDGGMAISDVCLYK